jgi:hypothetical protein
MNSDFLDRRVDRSREYAPLERLTPRAITGSASDPREIRSPAKLVVVFLLFAGVGGCSPGSRESGFQRYVPESAEARTALETVLSTWKAGPPAALSSLDPAQVMFVDQHRPPGQRLLDFRILGETEVENARQFTVRLTFESADEPELVRYNLFGRSPIWVYRLEDYELISHWEHKMDEPDTGSSSSKSQP